MAWEQGILLTPFLYQTKALDIDQRATELQEK